MPIKQIPNGKLTSIHIEMDGQELCHRGKVIINGVELGKGIKSAHITLEANLIPVVSIDYSEDYIIPSEKEQLGL